MALENQVSESEIKMKLFEILYERLKVMDFVYFPQEKIIQCSKHSAEVLNFSEIIKNVPESLVNNLVYAFDREKVMQTYSAIEHGKEIVSCEFRGINVVRRFYCEMRVIKKDANGNVIAAAGILQKIMDGTEVRTSDKVKRPAKKKDIKLLVVDDNKVNLLVAGEVFKPYCFNIDFAESGAQALDFCQKTQYDAIFMDYMMPEMDGKEAMDEIRKMPGFEKIPVVALSANDDFSSNGKNGYKNLGFDAFIPKPLNAENLNKVLEEILPGNLSVKLQKSLIIVRKNQKKDENTTEITAGNPEEETISDSVVEVSEDVLRQVYKDGIKKIKDLPEYVAAGNLDLYAIEVHALKSVMAAIGKNKLSALAKLHEQKAKSGDLDFVKNNIDDLLKDYSAIISSLGERFGLEEEIEAELPAFTKDEFYSKIKKLQKNLDDYDLDELKKLCREMQNHKCTDLQRECLDFIYDCADSYDYEGTGQKIAELNALVENSEPKIPEKSLLIIDLHGGLISKAVYNYLKNEIPVFYEANPESLQNEKKDFTDLLIFISSQNENSDVFSKFLENKKEILEKISFAGDQSAIENFRKNYNLTQPHKDFLRPVNAKSVAEYFMGTSKNCNF